MLHVWTQSKTCDAFTGANHPTRRTTVGCLLDDSRCRRAQRRDYFDIFRRKRSTYWTERVNADQTHPCKLWRSFDELLCRGQSPTPDIDATALHRYFDDKVAGVRCAIAGAHSPSFTPCLFGCTLRLFSSISAVDVEKLVQSLTDKQCLSDPLPSWLLKTFVDVLAPFLCRLLNVCLQHGIVPSRLKSGYITPRLKKADLDASDVKSHRPISNLSVLSKLLERLVAQQLVKYLMDNRLLPDLQSAYRAFHSTETALLKVLSDMLLALDSGNLVTLLDLSAAFDSVDHDTLIRQLRT